MSLAIFLIGFVITILFIIGQFKEKQTEDKLRIDYKNYYERYNIEREKKILKLRRVLRVDKSK